MIVNYHCQHLICRCLASLEALGTLVSFCGFHDYTTLVKLPGAVIVFGIIRRQPKLVRAFFRGYWDGLCDMSTDNQAEAFALYRF